MQAQLAVRASSSQLKSLMLLKTGYAQIAAANIGTAGLFAALAYADNVAIPAAIAAASPLATVLLAWRLDRERLSIGSLIGALAIVTSIVALTVAST